MKEIILSIVICTRNRNYLLNNLLFSISNSSHKPHEVIVVSSGQSVLEILDEFSTSFRIRHEHVSLIGQSYQKKIAIGMIDQITNWVFFLDDDLLLMSDTLSKALEIIKKVDDDVVGGIGTQILNLKNKRYLNIPRKRTAPKTKLGKISKSGRAISYQNSDKLETEWLNGASIWKKDVLNQYQLPILNSRYAAYEDVIFSTKINETYKLIFEPQIKIIEQISHNESKQNISAYSYINLWTGFFVCIDKRTKLSNYKGLVVLRFLKFLFLQIGDKNKQFKDSMLAFILAWKLFRLPNDKIKSKQIILELINNQILN